MSVTVINNAANRPQRIQPAIVSRMSPSWLCRRVANISLIELTPAQIRKLCLCVCVSLSVSCHHLQPSRPLGRARSQSFALPVVLPSQSSIQCSLWRCQLISWVVSLVIACISLTELFVTNPPPCISTRTTFSTAVVGDVWRLCKDSYQPQTDNSFSLNSVMSSLYVFKTENYRHTKRHRWRNWFNSDVTIATTAAAAAPSYTSTSDDIAVI